ncbi:unnamed protein product [Withania somnifera]
MEKIMMLKCNQTSPFTATTTFPTTSMAYTCCFSCFNVVSFRFSRSINMGFCSFQRISKRSSVISLSKDGFWEEPDDGSDSEDDDDDDEEEEEDNDVESSLEYGGENKVGEVEQLLSPEEREIWNRNQTPELDEISTAKWKSLHTFVLAGQIRFMDRLLDEGLDIDVVDKDGVTPLHYAVQEGAMQTVKMLIKYKVDVNVADNEGWTPLHVAMQSRNRDIAKILLVKGADKYRKNKDGKTPLDISLCYGKEFKSYDLAKLLKLVPANREL